MSGNPWNDSEGFAREAAKVESAGEALLLALLWWRRDGWTVRAQEPLERFRIDLFVPEARLAIEVDSFAAHGSAEAMERDARKRNLALSRGLLPFSYSAQQTLFHPHDVLAEVLANIGRRLAPSPRPGVARAERYPVGRLAPETSGAFGRALLASLGFMPERNDDLRLSPSQRAFANRSAAEHEGVELLGIVLDCPPLIREQEIAEALDEVEGPIAGAADALRRVVSPDGKLDREELLRRCPALLYPIVAARLACPVFTTPATARAAALALLARRVA